MSEMILNNMFLFKFYDMLCTHNIRITTFNQQPYYHGTQYFFLGALKDKNLCSSMALPFNHITV